MKRLSPSRRFKSPPRPTGLAAGAPAGGTRLGKGLAEPRRTPRAGHTVARLSPATPTRLRHADGPRLSRSGSYIVWGSRPQARPATVCRTPLSTPEATPPADYHRPDSAHRSTLRRRTGGVSFQNSDSAFYHDTTKTIPVNTVADHTPRNRDGNTTAITRRCVFGRRSTPQKKGTLAAVPQRLHRTSFSTNQAGRPRLHAG